MQSSGILRLAAISCFGLSLALGSAYAYAGDDAPFARITEIQGPQGSVTANDTTAEVGQELSSDTVIKTSKDSFAQVKVYSTNSVITVKPSTEFHLVRPRKPGDEEHRVISGSIRAKVQKQPTTHFRIRTNPAVFGVRGTDFVVTASPLFNDAEVLVFEGIVEVESTADPQDVKRVKKSQWAGIGGRYGKKVTDPMTLSDSAIQELQKETGLPALREYPVGTGTRSSSPSSSSHSHRKSAVGSPGVTGGTGVKRMGNGGKAE